MEHRTSPGDTILGPPQEEHTTNAEFALPASHYRPSTQEQVLLKPEVHLITVTLYPVVTKPLPAVNVVPEVLHTRPGAPFTFLCTPRTHYLRISLTEKTQQGVKTSPIPPLARAPYPDKGPAVHFSRDRDDEDATQRKT